MDLIDNQETVFIGSSEQMFLREIGKFPVLSPEEEKELFIRYKNGDLSAKEELILKNLKLVVFLARKMPKSNLELVDKIHEGVFGLEKAIDKYDVDLGYKFSTYATRWIHQEIYRSVKKNKKVVSVSINMEEKLVRYRKAAHELTKTLGRIPSNEEIAKKLEVSVQDVERYKYFDESELSLNMPIGDHSFEEFGDFIIDEDYNLEDEVIRKINSQNFINLINSLDEPNVYKIVMYLRYGFYDNQVYTMPDIANYLGVTKQRIIQIIIYMQEVIATHPYFSKDNSVNLKKSEIINSLNIEDFFLKVKIEDIVDSLSELNANERSYIYSKFGPNLDLKTTVGKEELDEKLGRIIRKMKNIITHKKRSTKALLKKLK